MTDVSVASTARDGEFRVHIFTVVLQLVAPTIGRNRFENKRVGGCGRDQESEEFSEALAVIAAGRTPLLNQYRVSADWTGDSRPPGAPGSDARSDRGRATRGPKARPS